MAAEANLQAWGEKRLIGIGEEDKRRFGKPAALGLIVGCVRLEIFQIYVFQCAYVSGLKVNLGRHPVIECLFPAGHAQAPLVALDQPGEIKMRSGRGKVIATHPGEFQKLFSGVNAHCVQAMIVGTGGAHAVTVKAGHGICATNPQTPSQYIARSGHDLFYFLYLLDHELDGELHENRKVANGL